jgi:hypothetical protein
MVVLLHGMQHAKDRGTNMKEIYVDPIGSTILLQDSEGIPKINKFVSAFDGYRFYRTEKGFYAIEE